jgi:hypothetical protein
MTEIDEHLFETSRDLQTEHHLFFGGQRARHRHRAVQRSALDANDFDGWCLFGHGLGTWGGR